MGLAPATFVPAPGPKKHRVLAHSRNPEMESRSSFLPLLSVTQHIPTLYYPERVLGQQVPRTASKRCNTVPKSV